MKTLVHFVLISILTQSLYSEIDPNASLAERIRQYDEITTKTFKAKSQSVEDIYTPQFSNKKYSVHILLKSTERFRNPRDAVYNELGKGITENALLLQIFDLKLGKTVLLTSISGVTSNLISDKKNYGITFSNASHLDISWGKDYDSLVITEIYMSKNKTTSIYSKLANGTFYLNDN